MGPPPAEESSGQCRDVGHQMGRKRDSSRKQSAGWLGYAGFEMLLATSTIRMPFLGGQDRFSRFF